MSGECYAELLRKWVARMEACESAVLDGSPHIVDRDQVISLKAQRVIYQQVIRDFNTMLEEAQE